MDTQTLPPAEPAVQSEPEPNRKWYQGFAAFVASLPGFFATFFASIPGFINPVLAWIAGCDLKTMSGLPSGEFNKKAAIGLTMIFTIVVAAFAAGHAASIFLSPALRIAFAILWAGVIFSIDRAIIVFIDSKQAHAAANGNTLAKSSKWIAILGRIVIIFCMSYLTSTAVEMLIFEKEIDGILAEKRNSYENTVRNEADSLRGIVLMDMDSVNQKVSGKRGEHSAYIATLDGEIDTLQKSIQKRQDELQMEIQGRVGSGMKGLGPAAQAIYRNIMADSVRLAELEAKRTEAIAGSVTKSDLDAAEKFASDRLTDLKERIQAINESETKKLAQAKTVVGDGFKERYHALGKLWDDTPFFMFMVFLLLMLIESMPILLKLFSGVGAYENTLEKQYQRHRVEEIGKLELQFEALAAKQAGERLEAIRARQTAEQDILSAERDHLDEQVAKHEDIANRRGQIAEANARAVVSENAAAMSVLTKKLEDAKAVVAEASEMLKGKHSNVQVRRAAEEMATTILRQAQDRAAS